MKHNIKAAVEVATRRIVVRLVKETIEDVLLYAMRQKERIKIQISNIVEGA